MTFEKKSHGPYKTSLLFFIALISLPIQADTIDHFINIHDGIPKMEVKADPQAQAWARSARNVLSITTETIAETLLQANEIATTQGKPLFCLPASFQLNATNMSELIVQTYHTISSQRSDKDKMTVSQVAWFGIMKNYPCQQQSLQNQRSAPFSMPTNTQAMQHVGATTP